MADDHKIYSGEILDVMKMECDMEAENANVEMITTNSDYTKELELMKNHLKEKEKEVAALREMQDELRKEMGTVENPTNVTVAQKNKEVDCRSIFVGNVDYSCTAEEVQRHFQTCGIVNRVTILTDKFGLPKGFAYVEFAESGSIPKAISLNESKLHGRHLKVISKRTNVPGFKYFFPRSFNPALTYRVKRPYMPSYLHTSDRYEKFSKLRRPICYRPYASKMYCNF